MKYFLTIFALSFTLCAFANSSVGDQASPDISVEGCDTARVDNTEGTPDVGGGTTGAAAGGASVNPLDP